MAQRTKPFILYIRINPESNLQYGTVIYSVTYCTTRSQHHKPPWNSEWLECLLHTCAIYCQSIALFLQTDPANHGEQMAHSKHLWRPVPKAIWCTVADYLRHLLPSKSMFLRIGLANMMCKKRSLQHNKPKHLRHLLGLPNHEFNSCRSLAYPACSHSQLVAACKAESGLS